MGTKMIWVPRAASCQIACGKVLPNARQHRNGRRVDAQPGAMFFANYLGAAEVTEAFGIDKSFLVLFMVIIGGLGSILGSFLGAAFLVLLPVLLKNIMVNSLGWPTDLAAHIQIMLVGGLIVFFLIVEPHGLAQLWRLTKEKLRLWPFPY